jgi:hypothetical protein
MFEQFSVLHDLTQFQLYEPLYASRAV